MINSNLLDDPFFTTLLQSGGEGINNPLIACVLHDNVEVEVEVTQPEGQVRARTKLSQRGVSFTMEEDNLLVSEWLNISIDAIRETDQNSTQLWIRIHDYFSTYKKPNWPEHSIEKAKVLYQSTQKDNYNLDNCWNLLRHQPEWQVHMDNLPTKKKIGCSTIPIANATNVEVCESMSINLERPLGKNSEKERKRKRKRKKSSPSQFGKKLSNVKSDRRIMMIEQQEAASQADRDMAEIIELKKKKMGMEIMSLNVDNMNVVQREYFKSLQMEILEKHMNELNQM
ncbi:hypothetical protein CIPAW_07G045400 [Carya illinoinensis]|uniref:No apical meristem-associated C-terminal domain-containing protein n=1 Tax=Carya illinoinensis TaxID=32201 RepID=A0A8T1Q1Q1_CARIL|nr:hypothetical protein CIPAW_07G045400 [Carya illinoinensis]